MTKPSEDKLKTTLVFILLSKQLQLILIANERIRG